VIDEIDQALPSGMNDEKAVRGLLRGLRTFGEGQIRYFLTHPSSIPEQHPDASVLNSILDRIARDLELIECLANQRAWGSLAAQVALARVDRWANRAMGPASRWLPPGLVALTCLRGSTATRYLPFGGVLLLGLPYTCARMGGATGTAEARDLLAVLRALGRHLFRNGRTASGPIRAALSQAAGDLSGWSRNWLESAFAEVYACLIAGPVAALQTQDAALELPPGRFAQDDGASLPPVLAPKVHTRVLERLSLDDWAASLCKRWKNRLEQRGAPAVFRPNAPVTEIRLAHPRDELFALADAAYDLLQECAPGPKEGWRARYAGLAAYEPYALEALYVEFEGQLADLSPAHEAAGLGPVDPVSANWPERFVAEDRASRPPAPEPGPGDDALDWLAVLRADGWMEFQLM
jgi:hypothetical protein